MEEKCKFCDGELDELLIKKFNYWTIYLNNNQSTLGRMFVVLNRHGLEDTLQLTNEEWTELKEVFDKLTEIIKSLYNHDLMNYLVLQLKDRNHFHMHLVPRYKDKREVHGEMFEDEWGKPPVPSPKKELNKEILIKIKEDIKEKFKKCQRKIN